MEEKELIRRARISVALMGNQNGNRSRFIHGMWGSKIYRTWQGMMTRCTNSNAQNYPRYGGRGIKVCERWNTFVNFYEDMGIKPEGMSLDRIDNNGNYEPSNCRRATAKEQAANKRRHYDSKE